MKTNKNEINNVINPEEDMENYIEVGDYNLKCSICELTNYCDNTLEIPLCYQKRFTKVKVNKFLQLAKSSEGITTLDILDDIEKKLNK